MPRKGKRNKPRHKPQVHAVQKRKKRRWLGTFVGISLAVLGIILWWPFYVPNIRIDISSSSNNLLRSVPPSFSVINVGVLKAYDTKFICYNFYAHGGPVTADSNWFGPSPLATILSSNQSIDTVCPSFISPFVKESDIEFLVSFRPEYAWKRSYACARFVIKKNAYGNPQWFRQQPQDCKSRWLHLEKLEKERAAQTEAPQNQLQKQFSK